MDLTKLRRMNKAELFAEEKKTRMSARDKKLAKHHLYECRHCADAKHRYEYDEEFKEDKEFFVDDCGLDVCPYREHFESLAVNE